MTGRGNRKNDIAGSFAELDSATVSTTHWHQAIIASLGDLLDSGGIVAGAASFSFWVHRFHLPANDLGLVAALGANGISSAIGAWIGGQLGDRFGRKRIYTYDLLLYMVGVLPLIFAVNLAMILTGYCLIGFAIGIDIPASWSLIAELAPARGRRRLMGVTSLFWSAGIALFFAVAAPLSLLGNLGWRLLFVMLFLVAAMTWALRRQLAESVRWEATRRRPISGGRSSLFFNRRTLSWLLFVFILYGANVLPASMGGDFLPYALESLHIAGSVTADLVNAIGPILGMIVVFFLFMTLAERFESRWLFVAGAGAGALGWLCLALVVHHRPLVAFAGYLILGALAGIGEPFLRIWSVELFPTAVRGTAQSVIWGEKKLVVSVWALFVPGLLAKSGFSVIIVILMAVYAIQIIGASLFAPATRGRSLEAITGEVDPNRGGKGMSEPGSPRARVAPSTGKRP